jgi:hypothetical protein
MKNTQYLVPIQLCLNSVVGEPQYIIVPFPSSVLKPGLLVPAIRKN